MAEDKKIEKPDYKTEGKSTIQLLRERQELNRYREEKATGAPVPATFEEWQKLG